MATGTFTDSTSSNGMKDNWVTKVSYTTTRYEGYTMVEATLKLTTTYSWSAVLNNGYSLTINGDKVTGSGKSVPSNGTVTLLTHKVKITHTTDKKITISASVNANNIYYNSGGYYIGTYSPSGSVTLKPLPTKCSAPTSLSATPNPFTTEVKLSWSGANKGTANAISSYYIQYCTSSNNSTWGDWTRLTTVTSTNTSGSTTINMSDEVKNNYYVKFRIRTQGEAGDDYYSGYKTSSSIRRLYYTACTAPTSFSASPTTFESEVTLSWSGAGGGTNNGISKYNIRYAISKDGSTWGSAINLPTTTNTSYSVDLSSVTRGYYVRFAIQTEGKAGSSYASSWKYSSNIRRNPYSKCSAPTTFTVTGDKSNTDGDFVTTVKFTWSGAEAGSNNAISGYLIRYRVSSNKSTWGAWKDLKSVSATAKSGNTSVTITDEQVSKGQYVQFAIQTKGNDSLGSSYYSSYIYANSTTSANAKSFKRNPYTACTAPTSVTITSEADTNNTKHTNVFNNQIIISWSGATGGSSNSIRRYYIQYCTSSNGSTWSSWTSLQSSDLTPVGTSSTTVNVSTLVDRGQYMKVQIRTEGEAGNNYYSPYVVSKTIRRNSIPNTPTTFKISSPASLEYSKGDNIKLSWSASADNDNNLKYYQLQARVTTEGVWGSWIDINNSIASSTVSYTILSTLDLYNQVDNNEQMQFRIRGYDVFGEVSSYKTSDIVVRYDITGVTIGINGKWVNCQLYVCTNGEWIEQEVSAGLNSSWVDADDGT